MFGGGGRDPFDDPFFRDPFGQMGMAGGDPFARARVQVPQRQQQAPGVVIEEIDDGPGSNSVPRTSSRPVVEEPDEGSNAGRQATHGRRSQQHRASRPPPAQHDPYSGARSPSHAHVHNPYGAARAPAHHDPYSGARGHHGGAPSMAMAHPMMDPMMGMGMGMGMGGMMGAMMGSMGSMMSNMDNLMASAMTGAGRGGGTSMSYSSYSSSGPGGMTYQKTHTTTSANGVTESRATEVDGRTGQEKISITRGVDGRSRTIHRTRHGDGREETVHRLQGMSDADARNFDAEWQTRAAELPSTFSGSATRRPRTHSITPALEHAGSRRRYA